MKFLCDQCKAKYQISDEKVAGKTVRMKCRKCGHIIEIRAAVTESSQAGAAPRAASSLPPAPSPTFAAKRPAAPQRRDALSSAMQRNIAGSDETESHAEPGAPDEWYVAINGVPVGPIGTTELRRKAAAGSVTEASLVWREGLEEWRQLRAVPELHALIRDAAPRLPSRPPPPRASVRAPAPRDAGPGARASAPPARSNVIPLRSDRPLAPAAAHGAAALAQDPFAAPPADPFAAAPNADPFAMPQPFVQHAPINLGDASPYEPTALAPVPTVTAQTAPAQPGRASLVSIHPPAKKPFPWGPVSMLAAAIAFGVTAGVVVFLKKDPAPVQPHIVIQTGAGTAAVVEPHAPATGEPIPVAPVASSAATSKAGGPAVAVAGSARPAPSGSSSAADLTGLLGGGSKGGPSGPGIPGAGGSGPGGSLSTEDVQRTVGSYAPGVKRKCWDAAPPNVTSVNVMVSMTVGGDGSVQSASASGNDPSVSKCIEGAVRNWKFPATGGKSTVNVPFKFVRQ